MSFSSFDLEFREGLNVIVGPNGAGKSNVIRLVDLMRSALDIAVRAPLVSIDVVRHLRIGAPSRQGHVSLGIELTEVSERMLALGFVRALVASSMDRTAVESPSVDSAFEQQVAARVRDGVREADITSLLRGRLVLCLDGGPPSLLGLAYEFDHEGTTYNYGLAGSGVPTGWVAAGTFALSRRSGWGGTQLDLSAFITGSTSSFSFTDLLPPSGGMTSWDLRQHPSGGNHFLPLSEELARSLDVVPQSPAIVSLNQVLYRAVRERIVLTENLRRPPRTVYELSEIGPPVAFDDAGDLPLELYRRRVSPAHEDRRAFKEVQDLFGELTGHGLEIVATVNTIPADRSTFMLQQTGSRYAPELAFKEVRGEPGHQLRIQPVVPIASGEVPVELAGAGVWEALVACTFAVQVPGRVVLLDEPAVNMHPTWQRRLLARLADLDQVIMVTHSPYLVPAQRIDDLSRVTRLHGGPDGTTGAHLHIQTAPGEWQHRWRQIVAGSAEPRAALFSEGVVLLEGDTELGAFGYWFSHEVVTQAPARTHDALNIQLLVVASDKSFGPYVSYLNTFGIPWAIICDGPVLSPNRETSLLEQLTVAGVDLGPEPARTVPFADWKVFWHKNGVFTVADRFGGATDDRDKSGEVEAFFARIDEDLWRDNYHRYAKSKVRAGYSFAEEVNLDSHQDQLTELRQLWADIITHIRTDANVPRTAPMATRNPG